MIDSEGKWAAGEKRACEALFEQLPVGFVRVAKDGSIIHANRVALDFLGLTHDAITQRYTADFRAVDETGAVADARDLPATEAIRAGKPVGPKVYGVDRPDGERRWGLFQAVPHFTDDHTGELEGAMVSFLDITGQRRSADKLRESEARLWSLLDSTPTIVLFADRDLKIQYLNRYAEGFSLASVKGRSLLEFLPEADRERARAVIDRVLATGQPAQYEVPPNDGVYDRWFATHVGPIKREGVIVGVVLSNIDITDRVELQSRLLVADRLASQGILAASIVHEINNPLTYVMANLQRIQRRRGVSDEIVEMAGDALEGAERIRNVVRDLSSLSRTLPQDESAPRSDVRLVLESSARMAKSELQHRAKLVMEHGDVPPVRCEATRLGQVFLNILINAAQAIPVGSAEFNEVRVSSRTGDDGWAVIEIRDTGEGLSKDLAERIFEPFVTLKSDGSGLGLYISSSILRAAGGRLSAEANPERGSCFRIELPPAGADLSAARPLESFRRSEGCARVLVIDDEEGVLGFMRDALAGHQVTTAKGGLQALELIGSHDYDVIFCDLIMPDVSGMQVFETLREERPELVPRLVFMTGGAFTPKAREFLRTNPRPVLEKPFDIADVHALVSSAIASR